MLASWAKCLHGCAVIWVTQQLANTISGLGLGSLLDLEIIFTASWLLAKQNACIINHVIKASLQFQLGYQTVSYVEAIPRSTFSVQTVNVAGLRECWQTKIRQWAADRRTVNDWERKFVRNDFNSIWIRHIVQPKHQVHGAWIIN